MQFFYIKNKIDAKALTVTWCPTDKTVSDYLSKPLSGEKFRQYGANIMNLPNSFLVPLKPMPKEGRYFNFHNSGKKTKSETSLAMIKVDDKAEQRRRNFDLPGGIRMWTMRDLNASRFFVTDSVGPKWSSVISRTTYDNFTGIMIDHLKIIDSISHAYLTRKLPVGSYIRTILFYKEDDEECNKSEQCSSYW